MPDYLTIVLLLTPIAVLVAGIYAGRRSMRKTGNAKRALKRHFLTVAVSMSVMVLFAVVASAADNGTTEAAAEAAAETAKAATGDAGIATGLALIAAGLSMGLAGIGGGIALAGGIPAAIGATAEDPAAFGKALIFVALGEAVALYGLIIALMIVLKVPANLPALG